MVFIHDSCFQEDYAAQGIQAMKEDLLDRQFKLNVEYRIGGQVTPILFFYHKMIKSNIC